MASRVEIYVSCSQQEALRRIATAAPALKFRERFNWGKPARTVADVLGDGFSVRQFNPSFHNSFAPQGSGTVKATPQGSLIRVEFGTDPLVIAVMYIWFGVAGLFTAIILAAWIFGDPAPKGTPVYLFLFAPPVMASIGALIMYAGREASRPDEAVMARFLENLFCDVRLPAPPSPKPSPKP
jgi:hypothetical protein